METTVPELVVSFRLLLFLVALLADLAIGSGLLAALVVTLLASFNSGFAAALLVSLLIVGFGDGQRSEQRGSANSNGEGFDELHIGILNISFCV
jgi:hypothetical protein